MSIFGVILVSIFPAFGLNTPYLSVFSPNLGKCWKIRTRITPNTNTISIFQRIFCIARQHEIGQLIKNRLISPTLTLSWRRSPLYRNQTNDLQSKSMDRFLYDREPLHERVKHKISRTLLFDLMCLFLFDFDNQNNQ